MDQFISVMGKEKHALLIDCRLGLFQILLYGGSPKEILEPIMHAIL